MEPPTVLQNQSEVTVWAGAEHVDVDTFSWDLPIKVLPTNPALASYVSQFTGTNSINIWLWGHEHEMIRHQASCIFSGGIDRCLHGPVCVRQRDMDRDTHFGNKQCGFLFPLYMQSQWWMLSMQPVFWLGHMHFLMHPNIEYMFLLGRSTHNDRVKCSPLCGCCASLYLFHFCTLDISDFTRQFFLIRDIFTV